MANLAVARQHIDVRLKRLRSLSFYELIALRSAQIEDIAFGQEQWSITTYRLSETNTVRIVVQIGPPQPTFMLLHVQADGLRMYSSGTITPLGERELYEFK
jgi:hypothetical protein